MMTTSTVIVADLFPLKQRGLVGAISTGVWAVRSLSLPLSPALTTCPDRRSSRCSHWRRHRRRVRLARSLCLFVLNPSPSAYALANC